MKVTLTVTGGPHQGAVHTFDSHATFLIGRSQEAHFRLVDQEKRISRLHCMIEVNPPRCRIMDMASRNGTKVNGERVLTAELKSGDVVEIGETAISVGIEGLEPEVESPETICDTGPVRQGTTVAAPAVRSPDIMRPPTPPDRSEPPVIPGYRVERELGRGGMGVVHLARGKADDQLVAIKTIVPEQTQSSSAMARFLREASILRRLEHPQIVRFLQIGAVGEQFYFVMDYVSGCNASQLIRKLKRPLPVGLAVDLTCQAAGALAFAHGRGFVHRDVKPSNLLVFRQAKRYRVKLADFGLARLYEDSPLSGLTFSGQIAGTLAYAAPEQVRDFRASKPPVDQYSLAATLYTLLTAQMIHDLAADTGTRLLTLLDRDPVPIRSRCPDLPKGLAKVVHKGLARRPEERFPDLAAFREALLPYRTVSSRPIE